MKSTEPHTQIAIEQAVAQLGPAVSRCLMKGIGGDASRSELDKLSDPLKKLVTSHVAAPSWLEAALLDPLFPGTRLSLEEKTRFLKKIIR